MTFPKPRSAQRNPSISIHQAIKQPPTQTWKELPKLCILEKEVSLVREVDFKMRHRKKNMNDVRGQEMPENTLFVVLDFPEIQFFAICGKSKGGLEKMTKLIKFAPSSRTHWAKKISTKVLRTPSFLGKTHFFLQNFKSCFLSHSLRC